ncbi:MAG TPA: Ig-like domain-containing protein, partial [Verrucomicrobiae bacterium]|nr:Ig-like domain-containing protein [Verrucomicrobiae bacterium]
MTKLRAVLLIALATTVTTVVVLTRPKPISPSFPSNSETNAELTPVQPPIAVPKPGSGAVASGSPADTTATRGLAQTGLQPIGAKWNVPAEDSAFGRFGDWAVRFQAAADDSARAALEAEGVKLAGERRTSLHSLVQSDPKRALELAVPLAVRENLPASVNSLLESRVSGRGDYSVLAAYPLPGQEDTITPIRRTLSLDGVDYRAFVYGVRTDQPTKRSLPINGIAVDDVVALSENPVRRLEPGEIERLNRQAARDAVCGVSTQPVTVVNEPTPVEVAGEITWLCRDAHAEVLNSQLQLAASQPGTAFLGEGELAESPYTEGRKRIIMMRVAFSNLPTPDVSSNSLVTVHAGVDSFWRTNSYRKTELAALRAGSDIVQINLSSPSTAYDGDAGALRSAVRAQATAQGIDLTKYDFDVIYTGSGRPAFDFGGLGFVGSPGAWVVGGSTSISCHELGHNLGAPHANFWDTGGRTAIGTGDNEEYGDPYDVMGGGSASGVAAGHYVAKFKWRMGWLSDADFPRITASGTYRIYAHDLVNSSGVRGVRFAKDASLEYFLEFRQLYSANQWMMDGVGLRWGSPSSWSSQIIDTTPRSAGGKTDANIAIGRTFSDTAANVHVTPIGKGHTYPESIDVVVQLGAPGGNQPPVAIVSASTVNAGVGEPITLTATATDPNGDRLAYYWQFSDNPSNVSFDNSPVQTVSFGAAGEYSARCVVSDMRGGTAQQTVLIRVGGATPFRISGHIVDNLNRPLAGILVTATGPTTASTYSDSDGSYALASLSAGSYSVDAFETVSGSITFLRPYFSSPVAVGPSFATADFVGLPGNVNAYTPLVPKVTSGWRYNDTGTDLGTTWRTLGFNDASWASGTAPLGYPSGNPITTVVGFGPNSANKYPTTYFRKQFTVNNPATYTNLLVELLRDDGAVVYLNGTEIVRDNMPGGTVLYSTYASDSSSADAYRPTTIPATLLVAGNNVLGVEIHQANATSSDIVMDVGLSGLSVSNVTGLKLAYLVEPANGAQITSPATINLRANVLTGSIPVTRVDFYADGVKVAESFSAPYLAQWASPPDGAHTLYAVAILETGQLVTPSVRTFVGPAVPPSPTVQLIAASAFWKYLAQASAPPSTWPQPSFNDTPWPAGPAELGFGDGDEATVVPGGPTSARFTTIYFRRAFVVQDPAAVQSLNALLKRDDGAVIYLNGTEVARDNMPAGAVTYATLAASATDDGESVLSHVLPATGLVHGTNLLAVEVHQSALNSSDLSFELSLSALLRTNRTRGCWVTSPSSGSIVDLPGAINITAEVVAGGSLLVSLVEFFADGIKIGEDTSAPFTFAWANPPAGSHALTAVATDSEAQSIGSDPINITVTPPPISTALISFGDVWKYRDDGANLGSSWTGRLYDDRTWMTGASKLGYATPSLTTTVSFGPNANDKHITTYFRRAFFLPSPSGFTGLLLRLVRDDAAVVYLNGLEVYRDNLQAGPISWNSTALSTINSPADATPVDVILPVTGLLTGTNVLSVEVHQVNATSSDLALNVALSALVSTNTSSGIYLANPAQNARFYVPAAISLAPFIAGTLSGPVEFFANGNKIGESSVPPYEFNWNNPSTGAYSVVARATLDGAPLTSPAVSITVGATPPPIQPVFQTLISRGTAWKYL